MPTAAILCVVCSSLAVAMLAWATIAQGVFSRRRFEETMRQADFEPDKLVVEDDDWEAMDRAPAISRLISEKPLGEQLQLQLLRAGWILRPSELLLYSTIGAVLLGGLLTLSLDSFWMIPLGIAFGYILTYALLRNAQIKRNQTISAQLPDVLDMLISSARAGYSFSQGMSRVQAQKMPPITAEFGRCLEEVQLGRSLSSALEMMVARTANYDLALMVCAVQTQLETGGNMAEVLGKIASMIRERVRLQGEINVGSAEGRFAAVILIALPIALLLLLRIMSPDYLEPLFTTTIGQLILGAAALLMIVGAIILKRLTTIRI